MEELEISLGPVGVLILSYHPSDRDMAERPGTGWQYDLHAPMGPIHQAQPYPPGWPAQMMTTGPRATCTHQLAVQPAPSTTGLRGNWVCLPRYPQPPPPPGLMEE